MLLQFIENVFTMVYKVLYMCYGYLQWVVVECYLMYSDVVIGCPVEGFLRGLDIGPGNPWRPGEGRPVGDSVSRELVRDCGEGLMW